MTRKLRWRPSKKQKWLVAGILAALGILVIFTGGYYFNWAWTGFGPYPNADGKIEPGRTLWDWMQLLIIPLVLAGGVLLFNHRTANTQNAIALDNQREAALQSYIDKMAELLLNRGLNNSKGNAEIRNLGRTRTLSVLRTLDGDRKGFLLLFLKDSQLIQAHPSAIIDLRDADLSGANLNGSNLSGTNLQHVNLTNASMDNADLGGADLNYADLSHASLVAANLCNATIAYANLSGANLTRLSLYHAKQGSVDLSNANLTSANLTDADLGLSISINRHSDLSLTILTNAILKRTKLTGADLSGADLTNANLDGADLSDAKLTNAKVEPKQLAHVKSLRGAIMPDRSKHS